MLCSYSRRLICIWEPVHYALVLRWDGLVFVGCSGKLGLAFVMIRLYVTVMLDCCYVRNPPMVFFGGCFGGFYLVDNVCW